ncbi:hypothetical protein CFIMG_008598RA00001 [Ceratocystis fimbriata CBS 114723]|uniref:mRNA deadenylase exonuclease subunit n=2 Tax=Ceratocystis TaxID=5157 RepID=A0A0F8BQH6_CERFI|nr:mRNA deadenylase exonuclease subunit [Ceratocystis platani]PHH51694.1 hypothetical protein CFIMG_008598RA00001 [Ceratocystis fimbriata CBS 114723]
MKLSLLFSPLLLAANIAAQTSQTVPLRVISFNIRYDASSRGDGEKRWDERDCNVNTDRCRRYRLTEQLKTTAEGIASEGAAVIGLQEVLNRQLEDVLEDLGSQWKHVGVGRDDGKKKGEFSPILYRPDVLELVHSEVKWLSPEPDKPSTGWGAKTRRIVTLAVFNHIATGYQFIHANTHLDNVSSESRVNGVRAIVDHIKAIQGRYGPLDVSLTGDFNSAPGGDASKSLADTGFLTDSYNLASAVRVGYLGNTYTGFQSGQATSRIDYIWFSGSGTQEQPFTATRYEILDNLVDGIFISDHRLVMCDVEAKL